MSTTTETTSSSLFVHTLESLQYAVTHVFLPHQLPENNDYTVEMDLSLARAVCAAAYAYYPHIRGTSEDGLWCRIPRMLDNLQASVQSERLDEDHIISQLRAMQTTDVLTLFIRPQNAAIILTKRENYTLCESFEVSPSRTAVGRAAGSLICSYPWSAVETPNEVLNGEDFQSELAHFLCLPDSDFPRPPNAHPQYITTLLTGILRGVGRAADVPRITKRVHDEADWYRSSLWLLIRVAMRMSLERSSLGRNSYKQFMLYFICTLARNRNNAELSNNFLHLMACKILRRLGKLGASNPIWLSEMALGTCACLQEILDARWNNLSIPSSPFRNPSQDDLVRDTKLSLVKSSEYICNALMNTGSEPPHSPFHPSNHRRGTLEDFLSSDGSFLEEAYRVDRIITLRDVERSVEQGIDDWLASVTVSINDACTQLEALMDKYIGTSAWGNHPEDSSITFLTMIVLFIALDKLVVKEIPMLADYSPEIPTTQLEELFLRKRESLNCLSRAYQYLAARHLQSRPGWSVLSSEFTQDSFPARYYDQSVYLQQIKARIDQEVSPTPLPALPLHAKVVVFEMQCPPCIRIWRSAVARIRHYIEYFYFDRKEGCRLLADVPKLRPYLVERQGPPLNIQIGIAYFYEESTSNPVLRYVVQQRNELSVWSPSSKSPRFEYDPQSPCREFVNSTTHTSNDVLASQAYCPSNFSLDEFVTFGHLRSGGSLQWLNILQGLRSRTLNLGSKEAHFLLSCAVFQVGPLDLNTGTWTWHHELQDACFCNALLDELEYLTVDIGARAIDEVLMSTASLLLSRILASSPSEDVAEKAVELLRIIRRKTFDWMQDLAYDLVIAPTNEERANLVLDMATTCRSTFDVDPAIYCRLFHSAMDVDALLSCFFHIQSLRPQYTVDSYSKLILRRDDRLSPALEEMLRDVILADPSDYGIDLAVAKVFASYQPGACGWKQLHPSNSRWLTCEIDQSSHRVHIMINLLDASLRVDGRLCGSLPPEVRRDIQRGSASYHFFSLKQIHFVTPSNLPGMDFMTMDVTPKYKVHFAVRDQKLTVRAQCNQTNEVLELIPADKFWGDLPETLAFGHVHWLNLSTSTIEIRPYSKCWEQSSENWRIHCASGQYRGHKGRETLVDIRSPTTTVVHRYFQPLINIMGESDPVLWNLLITSFPIGQSSSEQRLSVTLLNYGLSFFLNEGEEFESLDYRNMVYDENRSVGTLFGLKEFLVLRPKTHLAGTSAPAALIPRLVVVPNNMLREDGHHLAYDVDIELGCLMGNGSLTSTQFLAYMHATSSHHRPDLLTGKMGTQAALNFLQSAACRSIMKFKAFVHPGSRIHPQLNAAHEEIQDRYYWKSRDTDSSPYWQAIILERASQRTAHLFPSNATFLTSMQDCKDEEYWIPESDLELEDTISAATSAVYRWLMTSSSTISNWPELWSSINAHEAYAEVLLRFGREDSRPWAPDLVQTLINKAQEVVEEREETHRRHSLLFLLPTMAFYSPRCQTALFVMLVTFSTQIQSHLGNLPIHADSRILDGYRPTKRVLDLYIQRFRFDYESEKGCLPPLPESVLLGGVNAAVDQLVMEWPWETAPETESLDPRYWDVAGLRASSRRQFSSYYHNWILKEHLARVLADPGAPCRPHTIAPERIIPNEHASFQISLGQLLSDRPVPQLPPRNTLPRDSFRSENTSRPSNDIPGLDRLFSSLQTNSAFQREYVALLETSTSAVCRKYRTTYGAQPQECMDTLRKHYEQCRENYMGALSLLKRNLGPTTGREEALEQFGQWPALTADNLLRCLASTARINLTSQWKKCLVSLSLLLLELQRARRLLRFALDGLEEEFMKELDTEQCDGWDPEEYPDWLLIQIQGNFLIRRAQAETAMEMIAPQSGMNTVMQVNMGEGKSSVIIPIVAAALADGKQLVRVVVPKALTVQMFELLVSRLGGLANRPVYHLPFSRTPEYDEGGRMISPGIDVLCELMPQCIAERGILLVQPEHVVSLKLMSVQKQIRKVNLAASAALLNHWKSVPKQITTCLSFAGTKLLPEGSLVGSIFRWWARPPGHSRTRNSAQAQQHHDTKSDDVDVHGAPDNASKWLNLQKWLHTNVRDILDESDEILHPRFQSIYAIGLEQHMDGYPDRWTIVQHILRLVKERARTLSRNNPDSVYEYGPPGSFPHIRIAKASDVGQRLISMIVEDVMAGRLPNFSFFQHISPELRDAIRSFISDENVLQVADTAKRVEEFAKRSHQNHLWNALLLLRGLLASNILSFALSERRWRVDYGRDLSPVPKDRSGRQHGLTPTMLAVPYRAKDVPAPNTQFGHPDLTIILTCLSYYYAGLTEEQLRVSFEILLNQDEPSVEYAVWTEDYDIRTLPESLQKLSGINLRSSEQWDKVTFPLFSRNKATIDFYLARVLFPKEAKEFPWKLCGSSWDLGEKRERLITGFSGTSDGRWLLPMSVAQRDLDGQRGTNAKVLSYLLQPENDSYMVTHGSGERQTSLGFLRMVAMQRPEIRVLLDVGAQILDLSNHQVATAWLDIVRDVSGAIYFDENNELMVLTRTAIAQPLSTSPLSQQLGRCVVYLDHSHTRGTDLKFTIGSRAAVTLGPKVTKDALVQGCMRMRKLGHGHSVMFFAPPGVDQSIRAATGNKDPATGVTTADILCWAIHETWTEIQQRAPYWAQQGMNHKRRYEAWSGFCNNELTPEQLSEAWLQPEQKSLADLYAPSEPQCPNSDLSALDPRIRQRCKDLGVLSLPKAQMHEELEREVNQEREREQEVELPPKAKPAEHFLHPDVISFVKTGIIPPSHSGSAFLPVFTTLEKTSAATGEAEVWSPFVLATADFCRTIKPESTKETMDQYLRPVQWILSSKRARNQILVILSPFEADRLLPDIRVSENVHLHLYTPRTSNHMKSSDDLRLYTIPPLPSDWIPPWDLIDQLNVFAGQLYLGDYDSYLRLCRFLGIPTKESQNDAAKVRRNLFNIPGAFEEIEITFADSPLPSVMALLAIRTRGRPFAHTHMGRILQGQVLTERDFDRI